MSILLSKRVIHVTVTLLSSNHWQLFSIQIFYMQKGQKVADFRFSLAIDINEAVAYNTSRRGTSPDKILFAP